MLKKVCLEQAVGMVLSHDVTEIVPGVKKGPLFRKGHVITESDIPALLRIGKEELYLFDLEENYLHENEAAIQMAQAAIGQNSGLKLTQPCEGKVNITSTQSGLLKVHTEQLMKFNALGDLIMATAHTNRTVVPGEVVAGTKIIPLVMSEEKVSKAVEICTEQGPLLEVLPFKHQQVGLIITGSEVKKKRIEDGFAPAISAKLAAYNGEIAYKEIVNDDEVEITQAISQALSSGCEIIIVTGGMSVDPNDVTPQAIKSTGAEVVSYGVPVLPGSMFLLAYLGATPIIGLPSCAMYSKVTVFDLILPRLLAGDRVKSGDLISLGHGGLCLNCPMCTFPNCAFGKSMHLN